MSSPLHHRKIKVIVFDLGGTTFECQIENFQFVNNTPDGEKIYSMCPDGEDLEETDADWALTRELQSVLALCEIKLLDHFIVGGNEVRSLREMGWV